MLSPDFVNGKDLRVQIGQFNKAEVLPKKIKTIGVKKPDLMDTFLKAVESIPEGSAEEKKIPKSVIVLYNEIVEGTDPTPEEQEEMKGKKPKPRGTSREQMMYDLVLAGATEDKIAKEFNAFYSKKGVADEKFVSKRIGIYKNIAKKRIAKETGAPAQEEKKEKESEKDGKAPA